MRRKSDVPGVPVSLVGSGLAALRRKAKVRLAGGSVFDNFFQHGIQLGNLFFRHHLLLRLGEFGAVINDIAVGPSDFQNRIGLRQLSAAGKCGVAPW